MVALMEEDVFHQECAVVIMAGVETHVAYVCKIACSYLINIFISYCKAVCSDGCFNGGECVSPETCRCTSGWTGSNCTQGSNMCKS